MAQYVMRRLMSMVPTLVIVAFLSFMLMRLVPGDVILAQISASGGVSGSSNIDNARITQLKKDLGIQGTVPEQFVRWLSGVLQGDFGRSWLTNRSTLRQFI